MDCSPNALLTAARCFDCLFGSEDEVIVYLLCQWANATWNPDEDDGLLGGEGSLLLGGDGDILEAP